MFCHGSTRYASRSMDNSSRITHHAHTYTHARIYAPSQDRRLSFNTHQRSSIADGEHRPAAFYFFDQLHAQRISSDLVGILSKSFSFFSCQKTHMKSKALLLFDSGVCFYGCFLPLLFPAFPLCFLYSSPRLNRVLGRVWLDSCTLLFGLYFLGRYILEKENPREILCKTTLVSISRFILRWGAVRYF